MTNPRTKPVAGVRESINHGRWVAPTSRLGTEARAEQNRTQEKLVDLAADGLGADLAA